MVTCTECDAEIWEGTSYLAGRFVSSETNPQDGYLDFSWACEHKPAADAKVRLASKECVERFCENNPQYIHVIVELMSAYDGECEHKEHQVN